MGKSKPKRVSPYDPKTQYGKRGSEVDPQQIKFGKYRITIYRRAGIANSSWYFRMYLSEEKRNYRKSLGTTDIRQAKELATTEVVRLLAKVESGQHVLAVSLGDLKRQYGLVLQDRVKQGSMIKGGLSENTFKAHHYRLNHGFQFLQESICKATERVLDRRVSNIDGTVWDGYLAWRFAMAERKGKTIRRDVVRDELLSIRKMFLYARTKGLCTDRAIPTWTFATEKASPTRERMKLDDYLRFIKILRSFVHDAKNDRDKYNRLLLQHFVLVVSNSGMRSGELFGLKNKDVQTNVDSSECLINIRPETSKIRQGRQLTFAGTFGGKRRRRSTNVNYLIRWMTKYQIHKKPGDFVFPTMDGGTSQSQDIYYGTYKSLRAKLATIGLEWLDTYHMRHFWITNRLLQGHSIHLVAKVAGTSVREIERTYSHVMTEVASADMNKTRRELELSDAAN